MEAEFHYCAHKIPPLHLVPICINTALTFTSELLMNYFSWYT